MKDEYSFLRLKAMKFESDLFTKWKEKNDKKSEPPLSPSINKKLFEDAWTPISSNIKFKTEGNALREMLPVGSGYKEDNVKHALKLIRDLKHLKTTNVSRKADAKKCSPGGITSVSITF